MRIASLLRGMVALGVVTLMGACVESGSTVMDGTLTVTAPNAYFAASSAAGEAQFTFEDSGQQFSVKSGSEILVFTPTSPLALDLPFDLSSGDHTQEAFLSEAQSGQGIAVHAILLRTEIGQSELPVLEPCSGIGACPITAANPTMQAGKCQGTRRVIYQERVLKTQLTLELGGFAVFRGEKTDLEKRLVRTDECRF